jgi:hypothetical protein
VADDEIKDLMRGLLLTLLDVLSNQVASERKHGYSIRLLSTLRVAHAPLGKRLGSRQDNVGGADWSVFQGARGACVFWDFTLRWVPRGA